jgi:hypothetical protein
VRRWTVTYGNEFLNEVARTFPLERTADVSGMTYGEFMAGPVRAARLLFEAQWDELIDDAGGAVRVVHTFSPVIGPIVFFGILVGPTAVEIAGFSWQADYWDMIEGDPED